MSCGHRGRARTERTQNLQVLPAASWSKDAATAPGSSPALQEAAVFVSFGVKFTHFGSGK